MGEVSLYGLGCGPDRTAFIMRRNPPYRGTSLIRNRLLPGPYSRTMPRALWCSWGGGRFFISQIPLYGLGRIPRSSCAATPPRTTVQGYLAHKKQPTPPRTTIGP